MPKIQSGNYLFSPYFLQVDGAWLRRQVEAHMVSSESGIATGDLCSTIFDILTSSKSDEELQNEARAIWSI